MTVPLIRWDIYEAAAASSLTGVSMRGRTRKYASQQGINVLVENAGDADNTFRFAVLSDDDARVITAFIQSSVPDVTVRRVAKSVVNPVLSNVRINDDARYRI